MINFCPVCKSLLQIKEENGKNILFCNCGFKRYNFELESIDKTSSNVRGEGVINEEIGEGNMHICKKCGFDKAEIIDLGERDTNESGVYIYKCLKCRHCERESANI